MTRPTFALPAVCLLAFCGHATAAGFDCGLPALTAAERMVCATPALSTLDDQLSDAYKQSRARDNAVVADQRRWLADVRNRCTTAACLETDRKSVV